VRALGTIYKVCDVNEWRDAVRSGTYAGSSDDVRDGFIHFSTAGQLAETLRRHFSGRDGLVLVSVSVAHLGEQLRWEPSRGGDLFPHLYGKLDPASASRVDDLPLRADGTHAIPGDVL
jgi:uncharacterized protein (DUF952 family)